MQKDVAFDVNETLLDLSALDPLFAQNFGMPAVRKEWFSRVLQLAFVTTIGGTHQLNAGKSRIAAHARGFAPILPKCIFG
jgi:putative NADPH-quinone reductase